jgi:hypothetical protein
LQGDFSLDLGFEFIVDSKKNLRLLVNIVFVRGARGNGLHLIFDLGSEIEEGRIMGVSFGADEIGRRHERRTGSGRGSEVFP